MKSLIGTHAELTTFAENITEFGIGSSKVNAKMGGYVLSFDENEIVAVEAMQVKGGYQYAAITKNGSRIVLRKKATRLYEKAFFYNGEASSASPNRFTNSFTYGKKPCQNADYYKLLKTFIVKH